jgi:hypothetical protein
MNKPTLSIPRRKVTEQDTPIDMSNVMNDLETLGSRPGCAILSIGAVAFHTDKPWKTQLGPEFYVVINRDSCRRAGLHEDVDTLAWWAKQSEEASRVIALAEKSEVSLKQGLNQLTTYLTQFGLRRVKVWGNGADFDNAILACAYAAVGLKLPWDFWNNRCYRTLKNLVLSPKLKREGTYHNALDDAKTQANHAIELLSRINTN